MAYRNQGTDPLSLLEFISSLTERDSTVLQAKINTYLAEAVCARLVFLVIASPDEEDLLVHVLGAQSLPARVKVAVTTPCFDRALSTKQPTTLKHLNAQQQEDLFKVLHLLHSPAHLAASRQVSRTLSAGSSSSGGTPGRSSKESDPKNANADLARESTGSGSPCQKCPKVIPSSPAGDSLTSSDTHKNRCGKRGKSDTESPEMKGMSPLPREALVADNVFLYPSSNEFVRGQLTKLSSAESASTCNSDRFVKPASFLCVPLPYPDKRTESHDTESEECSSTAILACFIDKVPPEKARRDALQKGTKLSADERSRRSASAGPQNAGVDFRNEEIADFNDEDVGNVHKIFRYAMPLLLTTLAFESERRQRCHCQTMLGVAQNLFAKLEDVTSLLQEIMSEARSLTDAERCSLFLLDQDKKELVAKVFDGQTNDGVLVTESLANIQGGRRRYRLADGLLGLFATSESEVRLPSTAGIAGHVATTGKLLNIKDAYNHPLFYRAFDEKTGFRTRNMLCFPIQAGEDHHVIGVAELCNKMTGRCFTQFDEQLATSFSVFCGIAITHSLLYNKVSDAHARIKLSNELMMLHMNVTKEEVEKLTRQEVPEPTKLHPDFFSFSFFPRVLPELSTPLAVISMMTHLGIPQRWSIPSHTLARFVLMVRKGYRDPPYHNWVHAFSVTHFAFLLINNLGLCETGVISHMEALALMVSCLCHDLDHRGTTNSFQVDSNSVLASLYSSEGSVMERHHLAQTMCILNTESCNIFENLSKEEYTQCLDLMRDIILATDLAHHLRLVGELKQMAKDGYDSSNPRHRHLCICLLMTSADLSDQTKDWQASRSVAKLIYKEFFTQGDLEKAMGNNPLVMMDREKAFIPELQLSFLDNIALPVYQLVAELFPAASAPYESVLESKRRWTAVRDSHVHLKGSYASSLDIFDEDFILDGDDDNNLT